MVCVINHKEKERKWYIRWVSEEVIEWFLQIFCLKLFYNKINKLFGNKHEIGTKYQKVRKNT